ncbi:ABC transporter permease [Calothrix sp. NIES-3974]|uniref:ABC transporter permease n=1 Tax=Calothrix sp. NIES-3974 TaxID=2005462 RepID=UPI000B60DD12|nr:ABC transporter permease [Calothrix sp. NIES-3974]BAZ07433.1 ABC transporter permease protein [Calothrix sp. NIES-3974]
MVKTILKKIANSQPVSGLTTANKSDNLGNRGKDGWRKFRRNPQAIFGTVILVIIVLGVIFGPLVYGNSVNQIDFAKSTLPPTWQHPFGTNDLGQDILARILYGGRISIAVGIFSMLVAISLGILIGAMSGFYGGWIDMILMRFTDLCLALPRLPLLLLIIFLFRDSLKAIAGAELGIFILIVLLIGGLNWMSVARLVRAGFLTVREMEFVIAARAIGASPSRLIWIHILPNVISPVLVSATLSVSAAIITESTLSFLGLGFPPDIPTWGRMLYDAQNFLEIAPHMVIFPGTAIFLTVLSINYIGDALRDALDPRLS